MSAAIPTKSYLSDLLAGQSALAPDANLTGINRLRADAVDRVGVLTVPTTHDEDWRFTDISALTQRSFQPVRTAPAISAEAVAQFDLPEAAARLVFVDGVYAPQLSFNRTAIVIENLPQAYASHASLLNAHLGRYAEFKDNVFAALNTAFLHDGALIYVPREAAVHEPVHLLFVASADEAAIYPRSLLVAESGSSITLIEDFVGLQNTPGLTNAVSEIVVGENARVVHVRVQRESTEAFHIANCAVALKRAGHYQSVSVAYGARLSRYDLKVKQEGPGIECAIDGLALIGDHQLADTHSLIDHAHPEGMSRQMHKCIIDGAAHAVFNGKILVRQGAQRTDSSQSSRNLLLTAQGRIDTKPQLEIFADDVKCAHGATVGQLEAEELFYLRSRGLSQDAARNLLTYAFAAEIVERIPVATLKRALEKTVLARTLIKL